MTTEQPQITLFEIDDGATHWIAAESMTEALQLCMESWGFDSMKEWVDEVGATPSVSVYTKSQITIRTDDGKIPDDFPKQSSLQIIVPRQAYADLPKGLVATTEY